MKIALVSTEYVTELKGAGGLANYLYRLALALREMGHQPLVFTYSKQEGLIEHEGIPVYRMKVKNYGIELLDRLTLKYWSKALHVIYPAWKMSKLLRRVDKAEPFDIIQYTQLGAVGLFPLKNCPSVIRISSHTALWKEHGGYAESWTQIRQQEALENKACLRVDGVFGPSRFIAALFEQELHLPVRIIETPFFSHHLHFDPSIYNAQLAGKQYCLFFGTLSLHKGFKVIVDGLADFLRKYPTLHFVFAGKEVEIVAGKNSMVYLKETLADTDLLQRVVYLGQTLHAQLFPIIQGARVVTLPSLADNFPNACLEAMACGKIVIGTIGNGFDQLIESGKNGYVVEAGDVQALFDTLEEVMTLPVEVTQQIEAAAQQSITRLQPSYKVRELLDYYDEIIAQHKNGK